MNLPIEKSPCFCRVRQTVRLRFEFGGVEVLGAAKKTRQAGWPQPPAKVVVGPAHSSRVNQGPQIMSSPKSAKPKIRGVTRSIILRTNKIILAVKPRGSEFFGGVDQRHEQGCRESSGPRTVQVILQHQICFSPSSERDGIVKKKDLHNPARGYEGRSPLTTISATAARRIILAHGHQQVRHSILCHSDTQTATPWAAS